MKQILVKNHEISFAQRNLFDRGEGNRYNSIRTIFVCIVLSEEKEIEGDNLMKSTGIIRKVDELGRIVLPIELRRTLDIAERDELEIYMEGDRIILQKFEPSCIFCSSARDLVSYRGKNICQECVRNMGKY
jgi:transcriptional pleiotropic regulator of transition state genes